MLVTFGACCWVVCAHVLLIRSILQGGDSPCAASIFMCESAGYK